MTTVNINKNINSLRFGKELVASFSQLVTILPDGKKLANFTLEQLAADSWRLSVPDNINLAQLNTIIANHNAIELEQEEINEQNTNNKLQQIIDTLDTIQTRTNQIENQMDTINGATIGTLANAVTAIKTEANAIHDLSIAVRRLSLALEVIVKRQLR